MNPLFIAILCFILAGALAAADLFIPSGGILAIMSLLAAVVSIFFGFRSSPTAGMFMLVMILVAIPVFLVVALRVWPYTPLGRRIILKTPQEADANVDSDQALLQELVGSVGVTQNSLMPYGFVRLGHRNYNAVCESGVIEAGQNVEVIGTRERNLLVTPTHLTPKSARPAEQQSTVAPLGESLLDRPAEELGLDSIE